jgi:hypothetical protein
MAPPTPSQFTRLCDPYLPGLKIAVRGGGGRSGDGASSGRKGMSRIVPAAPARPSELLPPTSLVMWAVRVSQRA